MKQESNLFIEIIAITVVIAVIALLLFWSVEFFSDISSEIAKFLLN